MVMLLLQPPPVLLLFFWLMMLLLLSIAGTLIAMRCVFVCVSVVGAHHHQQHPHPD